MPKFGYTDAFNHRLNDKIVVVDARDSLPTCKNGKQYKKREIHRIKGICIHHFGGDQSIESVAKHYTSPNNRFSHQAIESIPYTYCIDKNGLLHCCNDIEKVVWSQGTKLFDGDENADYLSIAIQGNFNKKTPNLDIMFSLLAFIKEAKYFFSFGNDGIKGHYNFGKEQCPGIHIESFLKYLQ